MKNYKVEITEYLQRIVDVKAESSVDAVNKVEEEYYKCNIVLGAEDFTKKEIEIYNPNKFISKLDLFKERLAKFVEERDWSKFHTPANLAKSISIEANELLECFQWSDVDYNIEDVKDELADVMNYCIQMSMVLKVDIVDILNAKLDKTEKKYPVDKAKGLSTKYDKL